MIVPSATEPPLAPETFWIKTFGCQMNVYDSQRMTEIMISFGYVECSEAAQADVIILNTCHIREKASEKVFSDLGRLFALPKRPHAIHDRITVVAGCVAQAEGELLRRKVPAIDIIIGPQDLHKLAALIRNVVTSSKHKRAHPSALNLQANEKFDQLPEERLKSGVAAYLTIQEGCDKFCSFCVVPYTRGKEYGRPREAILAEAKQLATLGAREICLLGQNVNAWRGTSPMGHALRFSDLLQYLIEAVPQIWRWRYITSHPLEMTDDLIALHGKCSPLMPFLHLPIQSGSDRVLRSMNRRYTSNDYLKIADKLYTARPDLALSSDFIVGFPGETEDDFTATCKIIQQCRFVHSFSFLYSPRPGTPAASRARPDKTIVLRERLHRLQSLLNDQTLAFNERFIGQSVDVLFVAPGRHPGQWRGHTPWLQSVHVDCSTNLVGYNVPCEIIDAAINSMKGENLSPEPRMRACV